jgi:hypothetical protein
MGENPDTSSVFNGVTCYGTANRVNSCSGIDLYCKGTGFDLSLLRDAFRGFPQFLKVP